MTAVLQNSAPLLVRPAAGDLEILMRSKGLCASILMNTAPATRMVDADRRRLEALGADARRRLELEPEREQAVMIGERLEALIEEVASSPTDRALALFIDAASAHVFHLTAPLDERVVIDPTFATRDIVASVQANPRFLLLHLDSKSANLYRYNQKYLEPVLSPDFPALREGRVRAGRDRERTRAFLRGIDAGITRELASSAMPVVIVGGDRILAEFLQVTRNGSRVAGLHRGILRRPPLSELEQIGREVIAEHVEDLNAAALDTFDARMGTGRAVTGLLGSWHACATSVPEMLVVERGFRMPVREVAGGRYVEPVDDAETPGVIDDAVDDLIENVLRSGGFVSVVPDGTLRQHGRVALTLTR